MAGFRAAVPAEAVAKVMREAVETDEYRLRWLVGEDAEGLVSGRRAMSDEAFVAMGDLDDADYNEAFKARFGVEL